MSSRNGRYYAALGGLSAATILLIVAPSSHGQQPKQEGEKASAQEQQAEKPQRSVAQVYSGVVGDKARADRAQEPKDDARDSWVIRSLKFFDRHNGAFNAVAALAVMFFTYRLWRLSVKEVNALGQQSADVERSIAEAARSANAMEKVADAMGQSVETVKERTAQQMRAYITVQVGEALYQERDKNTKFEARPFMLNTGYTPAHRVRFRIGADIVPIPLPAHFKFSLPDEATGEGVLNSQQTLIMTKVVDAFIDQADVFPVMAGNGDRGFLVWGDIQYDDVFGDEHITRFAYYLSWRADGRVMGHYAQRHNDAS